jgi:phage shock protein C
MEKRLHRSTQNRVISGVCGGIAEYFAIDPAIIRLVWLVLIFAGGTGILAYILAVFIIPEKPAGYGNFNNTGSSGFSGDPNDFSSKEPEAPRFDSEKSKLLIGGGLVLFGIMLAAKQLFHWIDFSFFGPLLLILIGAAIIYKGRGRNF